MGFFAAVLAQMPDRAWAQSSPGVANTPAQAAQVMRDEGMRLFREKKYAVAAKAFEEAWRSDARPETLFSWAQALRLAGDCPSALIRYRGFLETNPPELSREAAQLAMARCQPEGAARVESSVDGRGARAGENISAGASSTADPHAAPERPVEKRTAADVTSPPPPARIVWADPYAASSAIVGVAVLAMGISSLNNAAQLNDAAAAASDYASYERDRASAVRSETTGVAFSLGAALALGFASGRYLYLLRGDDASVVGVGTRGTF